MLGTIWTTGKSFKNLMWKCIKLGEKSLCSSYAGNLFKEGKVLKGQHTC